MVERYTISAETVLRSGLRLQRTHVCETACGYERTGVERCGDLEDG